MARREVFYRVPVWHGSRRGGDRRHTTGRRAPVARRAARGVASARPPGPHRGIPHPRSAGRGGLLLHAELARPGRDPRRHAGRPAAIVAPAHGARRRRRPDPGDAGGGARGAPGAAGRDDASRGARAARVRRGPRGRPHEPALRAGPPGHDGRRGDHLPPAPGAREPRDDLLRLRPRRGPAHPRRRLLPGAVHGAPGAARARHHGAGRRHRARGHGPGEREPALRAPRSRRDPGRRRRGPDEGHRDGRRHRRRRPGGGDRGHPEDRRHRGARRALPRGRPPPDDPEARRLAGGALHRRDADGDRDEPLRERDRARDRARALRPAHHLERRQRRVAGDDARHSRDGARGGPAPRLVARRRARVRLGARPRLHPRIDRPRARARVGQRLPSLRAALLGDRGDRRAEPRRRRALGHARRLDAAVRPPEARLRPRERVGALRRDARRRERDRHLLHGREPDPGGQAPLTVVVAAMPTTPRAEAESRRAVRSAEAERLGAQHRRIARVRLAVFLAGVAIAWLALDRAAISAWWIAVPVVGFAALVAVHVRVGDALERARIAVRLYDDVLARIDDRWVGRGAPGDAYRDPAHPYAEDLDVFGRGSLFERISTARTRAGEATLAGWLGGAVAARDPQAIRARQAAVAELAPLLDLREDLAIAAADAAGPADTERVRAWGAAPATGPSWAAALAAGAASLATLAAVVAGLAFDLGAAPFFAAVAVQAAIEASQRRRVAAALAGIAGAARTLERIAALLARAEREPFAAPRLRALAG